MLHEGPPHVIFDDLGHGGMSKQVCNGMKDGQAQILQCVICFHFLDHQAFRLQGVAPNVATVT